MFQNKMSLRLRIFISMILLVFTATLLVLGSTYYQYRTESDQYNSYRQERKESQLKRQVNYIVNKYNLSENYDLWEDYQSDFEEITRIHSVEYSIFKIDGTPLFYSYLPLDVISNNYSLDSDFSRMLVSNEEGKFTSENSTDVGKFQASYSVLKDDKGTKYAILFFPYFQDVSFAESELNVFLSTLYQIYFIMLVVAIVLAYFISRFVTRSIETIRLKIGQAGLLKNIGLVIALREQDYKRKFNELQGVWDAISLVHPLIGTYASRVWGLDKNIQRAILNQGQVYFNNKPHTLSAILVLTQSILSKMGMECSGPVNWVDKSSIPSSKSTLQKDIPTVPMATQDEALKILDIEEKEMKKIVKEFVGTLKSLNLM